VCALRDVSRTAAAIGAGHLVSAIEAPAFPFTPKGIPRDRHLKLDMDDITRPKPAKILPSERHILKLLNFVYDWDQNSPLLIHCFAGSSRSTACAYIALCALNPTADEVSIARAIRWSCRTAAPNRRIIALADEILDRDGRMVMAVTMMNERPKKFIKPFGLTVTDFAEAAPKMEFLPAGFPFWPVKFWRDLHHRFSAA
jgi:predicted protein tyrosine phosphatase